VTGTEQRIALIAGAHAATGVGVGVVVVVVAGADADGLVGVPCIARDDDIEGVSWTGCSVLVAVARDSRLGMKKSDPRVHWATCPQGLTLPRGQKCLHRCLHGHGRYHRSVSSARTDRLVSSS
jgi:hypothetical protein